MSSGGDFSHWVDKQHMRLKQRIDSKQSRKSLNSRMFKPGTGNMDIELYSLGEAITRGMWLSEAARLPWSKSVVFVYVFGPDKMFTQKLFG